MTPHGARCGDWVSWPGGKGAVAEIGKDGATVIDTEGRKLQVPHSMVTFLKRGDGSSTPGISAALNTLWAKARPLGARYVSYHPAHLLVVSYRGTGEHLHRHLGETWGDIPLQLFRLEEPTE